MAKSRRFRWLPPTPLPIVVHVYFMSDGNGQTMKFVAARARAGSQTNQQDRKELLHDTYRIVYAQSFNAEFR